MKKVIISILLLFLLFSSIFAETETTPKIITAVKHTPQGSVPEEIATIRILNPQSIDIAQDGQIDIPSRNVAYTAFTWILMGNSFGRVKMTFTFYPMYWYGNSDTTSPRNIIPYTVVVNRTSTAVGEVAISTDSASTGIPSVFLDNISYRLADSVTNSGAVSVYDSSSVGSINLAFSFQNDLSSVVRTQNSSVFDYSNYYNVINYWTRQGNAVVTLLVDADGNTTDGNNVVLENGVFYATVTVEVTKD